MKRFCILCLILFLLMGCTVHVNTDMDALPAAKEAPEADLPSAMPPSHSIGDEPASIDDAEQSSAAPSTSEPAASPPPSSSAASSHAVPTVEDYVPLDDTDFVAVDPEDMLLSLSPELDTYPLDGTDLIRATVTNLSPGGAYLNSSNYFIDRFIDNAWVRLPVHALWTEEGPASLKEGVSVVQVYHLYTDDYTYEPGLYRVALLYADRTKEVYGEFRLE